MTALRTVTLSCEHDDCESTLTIVVPGASVDEPFQSTVRQCAHDADWTLRGDKDFCPAHRPVLIPSRFADCPREGCGRNVAVNADGSLRRHRILVDGELGPSCRDPVTSLNHTRYPNLTGSKETNGG